MRTLNTDQWIETVVWPRALCSTRHAMPVCDVRIVPSISRMLRAVVVVNVRWWLWARLCCAWKQPILPRDQSMHFENTRA